VNAGFRWEQPEYLVLVFAAACALAAYGWSCRTRLLGGQSTAGDTSGAGGASGSHGRLMRQLVRLGAALLAGLAGSMVGAVLIGLKTPRAVLAASVLAVISAAWLSARLYDGRHRAPGGRVYRLLVGLRVLAAIAILIILARPVWEWVEITWRKPLLAVVLDQSQSMGIRDDQAKASRSRAELANAALQASRAAIDRLQKLYEVRVCSTDPDATPQPTWRINPATPFSALAVAVQDAGQLCGSEGGRPTAVVLVSDGAENVDTPRALRGAAEALATQGTALLAVGVGPAPGAAHTVELDPLFVPARLGSRDRLRVPVTLRAQNCRGAKIRLELLWDGERADARELPIQRDPQRVQVEFDVLPPGPGLHRLTARAVVPESLGGQQVETHAVVDVRDDRIRILYLEDTPHTEALFVTRDLQADPRFELTTRFLFAEAAAQGAALANAHIAWGDYDVVILGRVSPLGADATLKELATAVTHRGVGLLLMGGRRLFNDADTRQSPLAALSPVAFVRDQFGLPGPLQFVPTRAGLQHAVLRGVAEPGARRLSIIDELARWRSLPQLGSGAILGRPKPLASVLARDAGGRLLLAAQEVGTGRCLAAGFESTWPWALASDEGAALHRRFWTQMVLWLANRRPQAWVLTDHPSYALAALKSGKARVRIRAGLSQSDMSDNDAKFRSAAARLELVDGEQRTPVRLEPHGDEWLAELSGPQAAELSAGQHQLEFTIGDTTAVGTASASTNVASQPDAPTARQSDAPSAEQPGASTAGQPQALTARTEFTLLETPLEFEPPTANLALLRAAAEATAQAGGEYYSLPALPKLLEKLSQTDRRQEVRQPLRYALIEQHSWAALLTAAAVLGLEWLIRKRAGLP
jgi:hypothetical protein